MEKNKILLLIAFILLINIVFYLFGCSGGASVSIGAGGSVHPQAKSADLAPILRETPVMSTTATRNYSLPMVGGND